MINFKNILFGITIFLFLISYQNQVFAQDADEKIFPDWIKLSTEIWVNGQISDYEFLSLIENVLKKNILPEENQLKEILKHAEKTVINDIHELDEHKTSELIPHWAKDRAEWWIEGKITDTQFLRTIHYLRETGYLDYNPEKNIFSNDETFQSSLERFLLNDKEVFDITKESKWRIFSTEYEFSEKEGIVDSVKIIFTDISRVYEPIFYKFKVPTLVVKILEFNNQNDLDNYWNSFQGADKEKIFDSAYLTGNPNENSECFFNYNPNGALTSCTYDNLIVQVIIFDEHDEHFDYDVKNLILDETEPTTRISGEILKKISNFKHEKINSELHYVLQNDIQNDNLQELTNVQVIPKSIEPEKSVIQGVKSFSCIRDDFGLVTISGQYNNDKLERTQVTLVILFLDTHGNIVGKTSTTLNDLEEFESKRFIGHSKWHENFSACQISIQ